MSSIKIGDNVWVKLAEEKIWWPSSIVSISSPKISEQSASYDPFSSGGFNDLMVIKYICATNDSDDAKLAILKLSEKGCSWDCLTDFDRRSQTIPASLKAHYDSAISVVYNEKKDESVPLRFDSISLVTPIKQSNPTTNGIKERSAECFELLSESDKSVRNRNIMTAATTEGYDLEGIAVINSNPNPNSINQLFKQEIEPSFLQNLDHKCSTKSRVLKRENVVPWDDYFMSIAFLSAMRSKDPSTQVGACIVNPDRRIVGIGKFYSCYCLSFCLSFYFYFYFCISFYSCFCCHFCFYSSVFFLILFQLPFLFLFLFLFLFFFFFISYRDDMKGV